MQCIRMECQTSTGCVHRGQLGQMCWFGDSQQPMTIFAYPPIPLGCICPPTSEQTCQNIMCPRKNRLPNSFVTTTNPTTPTT